MPAVRDADARDVAAALREALAAGSVPGARDAAYRWGMRLCALRALEVRGLASPVRFGALAALAPRELTVALRDAFSIAARRMPRLFAPDVAEVAPDALANAVALLAGRTTRIAADAIATALGAPDALGWTHQGWHAPDKDRVFEALREERGRKIDAHDLVPATQLYTEAHHVRFLLDNALGPLVGAPEHALAYRVAGAPAPRPIVGRGVTCIDPACGTGNFLLGALDVLAAAAHAERATLVGVELDARAVALAEAALAMRAEELRLESPPAIELHACDVRLASGDDALREHLARYPEDASLRDRLARVYAMLARLDAVGSLLALEEVLARGDDAPMLARTAIAKTAEHVRDLFAEAATTSDGRRDPERAKSLLAALARRYDVVATNPPYVGFRKLDPELKALVTDDPLAELDLYVAFLSRGLSLTAPGGALAAITPASWTTSSRTSALRRAMLDEGGPSVVAALGQRVFETAPLLFVSLAVVLRGARGDDACFVTLAPPALSGAEGLQRATRDGGKRWRHADVAALETLPFLPVAPPELLASAARGPTVGDLFGFVDGVWSGDNERDVREAWEVPHAPGWVVASGGQGYARYDAPTSRRIRAEVVREPGSPGARVLAARSSGPALEYARVAGGKLAARFVRGGSAAIAGVVTIAPKDGVPPARVAEVAAVFCSRLGTLWLRTLTSGLNFNPGYAARIPLGQNAPGPALVAAVERVVALRRALSAGDLACDDLDPARFFEPAHRVEVDAHVDALVRRDLELERDVLEAERAVEHALAEHLGLSRDVLAAIEREVGPLASDLPDDPAAARTPTSTGEDADDDAPSAPPPGSELEALSRAEGLSPRALLGASLPEGPARAVDELRDARRRAIAEDLVLFHALRVFGHRFPREARASDDGAPIVLETGPGPGSLLDALTARLDASFGDGASISIASLLGRPLDRFVRDDLFRAAIARFRRRPALWQLASGRDAVRAKHARRSAPAFSCFAYGPRAPATLLDDVRALAGSARTRLGATARAELTRFDATLAKLEASGYAPNPDAGVRANVAPLERAGLLAVDVIGAQLARRAGRKEEE